MPRSAKIFLGMTALVLGGLGVWQYGGVAFAKRSERPNQSRPKAESCSTTRPGNGSHRNGSECSKDSDCTAGKNGRCLAIDHGGGRVMPVDRCSYDQCFVDADCGANAICSCGHSNSSVPSSEYPHVCIAADCKTDADCGSNGFCSPTVPLCARSSGFEHYYCHTSRDECMVDSDCPRPTKESYGPTDVRCGYSSASRRWVCMSQECPVG